LTKHTNTADARFVKFAENLLTGHIGAASAKILISSVVKEDKIKLEVLRILERIKKVSLIKANRYFDNLKKNIRAIKKR
jgi:hypothetical protein